MVSRAPGIGVVETHISTLFFSDELVFKLKKPVAFGFLDFSTRAAREAACHREVELNRRLAPDVYRGVATVVGPDGEPMEHLVVMRRMPEERRLSRLLGEGDVSGHIRAIARTVARFHAAAETTPEIERHATADAVRALWDENLAELAPFEGRVVDRSDLRAVGSRARRFLEGRAPLFAARIAGGYARDGHGDLLADDIFCLDDGPRILDCIEFNDRFRYADVLADVAFLAMDLERLGHADVAERFLADYREFSGATYPRSLVDHYIAYRALVRCKIACIRADQGDASAQEEARLLLRIARAHLDAAEARLVIVGGLPGSGKTTLANGIADALGLMVLHSDEVRKDLAGLPHGAPSRAAFGEGLYRSEMTERTYEQLLVRARALLEMGESVVLDASWTGGRARARAAALAREMRADLVELACVAPRAVAAQRMLLRRGDASDATPEIAVAMEARADPWPTAIPIHTTVSPEASLSGALRAIASEALKLDEPHRPEGEDEGARAGSAHRR